MKTIFIKIADSKAEAFLKNESFVFIQVLL